MKHLAAGFVVLVLFVGGFLLVGGSGAGEPLAERDAFFEGDLVYDYAPEARGGTGAPFRLTVLGDGRWLLGPDGARPGSYSLFDGVQFVEHRGDTCVFTAPAPGFLGLLIPGFTVSHSILNGVAVDEEDGRHTYEIARDQFSVRIEEDLSQLADGTITATTRGAAQGVLIGMFTIHRATAEERTAAIETIARAVPVGEMASLTIRSRYIGTASTEAVSQPFALQVVPPVCHPGASEFVVENLRVGFVIGRGPAPVVRDAFALDLPIDAPREVLLEAGAVAAPGDLPLSVGSTFAREIGGGLYIVEVIGCRETAWFSCGEPESATGRR